MCLLLPMAIRRMPLPPHRVPRFCAHSPLSRAAISVPFRCHSLLFPRFALSPHSPYARCVLLVPRLRYVPLPSRWGRLAVPSVRGYQTPRPVPPVRRCPFRRFSMGSCVGDASPSHTPPFVVPSLTPIETVPPFPRAGFAHPAAQDIAHRMPVLWAGRDQQGVTHVVSPPRAALGVSVPRPPDVCLASAPSLHTHPPVSSLSVPRQTGD